MRPSSPRALCAALVACAVVAPPLAAQPCPRRAPRDTSAYLACQVDEPPRPDPANAAPAYPAILRGAAVGGTVRATFVVDTSGRVDTVSWRTRRSSHELFTDAARDATAAWRFAPARRGGAPVRARYELRVAWTAERDARLLRAASWMPVGVARRVYGRGRERIELATELVPRDSLAPPLDEDERRVVLHATFAAVVREVEDAVARERPDHPAHGTPVDYCVRFDGVAASRLLLSSLDAAGRRVYFLAADCPPTYHSAVQRIDLLDSAVAPAPPPRWRDPVEVTLFAPAHWNAEYAVSGVDVGQGGRIARRRCFIRRDGSAWRARCGTYATTLAEPWRVP